MILSQFIIYTTATVSSAYNDDSYTDDGKCNVITLILSTDLLLSLHYLAANYPDGGAYDEGKGNEDYGGGGGAGAARGSEKGAALNSAGGKGGGGDGGDGGDDHGSVDGAINSKHTVSFKQISTHSEVSLRKAFNCSNTNVTINSCPFVPAS